jgi:hypothetical protein
LTLEVCETERWKELVEEEVEDTEDLWLEEVLCSTWLVFFMVDTSWKPPM